MYQECVPGASRFVKVVVLALISHHGASGTPGPTPAARPVSPVSACGLSVAGPAEPEPTPTTAPGTRCGPSTRRSGSCATTFLPCDGRVPRSVHPKHSWRLHPRQTANGRLDWTAGLAPWTCRAPVPCRPTPTPRPVAAARARTRPLGPIRVRSPPPAYRPAEEAASGPCAGVNDGAKKGHVAEHEWAIEPAGPLSWRFFQLYPQVRTPRKGAPSVSS